MQNLFKVVFWFENTRNEIALGSRLSGELIGIANSIKGDLLDPGDLMFTSSKLVAREGIDLWEWYGKIASDTANTDVLEGEGTQTAEDDIESRLLSSLTGDPFTVGTPVRVR